jgi:hypothetical protein
VAPSGGMQDLRRNGGCVVFPPASKVSRQA